MIVEIALKCNTLPQRLEVQLWRWNHQVQCSLGDWGNRHRPSSCPSSSHCFWTSWTTASCHFRIGVQRLFRILSSRNGSSSTKKPSYFFCICQEKKLFSVLTKNLLLCSRSQRKRHKILIQDVRLEKKQGIDQERTQILQDEHLPHRNLSIVSYVMSYSVHIPFARKFGVLI